MERDVSLQFLHRHYVAWLLKGQWEPELSLPPGTYPEDGERVLLEWRLPHALDNSTWNVTEKRVEAAFSSFFDVWTVCTERSIAALALGPSLSTPRAQAELWVAATRATEDLQRLDGEVAVCTVSEAAREYQSLAAAQPLELHAWWARHARMGLKAQREHRRQIQRYLKKGQFGHISGYVARCLKADGQSAAVLWCWIPLVMESLWRTERPSMECLTKHLHTGEIAAEGAEALVRWVRKTCDELKACVVPEDPIQRVTESIARDCSLPYAQTQLAESLGLTPAYFSRLFEKRTGKLFSEYLTNARIARAKELLESELSLLEVAQASGFQQKSYFCEVFRKKTGETPLQYRTHRKKGQNRGAAKSLSLKEISELVGVSTATVSRVLNQNGRFSKQTEQRVRSVIAQYQYVPNLMARGLRRNVSQIVGLIVPDITNEFFARIVLRMQMLLFQENYSSIICNTNESEELETNHLQFLRAQNVGGLVFISGRHEEHQNLKTPFVFIDRPPLIVNEKNTLFIESDNFKGGYLAGRLLIERGAKRIATIMDSREHTACVTRYLGWQQAMQEAGMPIEPGLQLKVEDTSYQTGHDRIVQLLAQRERFDALFCGTDWLAVGAMVALREGEVKVPAQVKVIGFDDISIAGLNSTPVTSVRQDTEQMGTLAVELLLRRMRGDPIQHPHRVLDVELIERGTT